MYAEFVAEMDSTNSGTVMDEAYVARKQRLADLHKDRHQQRRRAAKKTVDGTDFCDIDCCIPEQQNPVHRKPKRYIRSWHAKHFHRCPSPPTRTNV